MLRLHYHPFAQYCQKVLIALYEHDLSFERRRVNLGEPDQRAALAAIWPFARFPVLESDVGVLGESGVIIEYLDTLAPTRAPLVPSERMAALEPRMLERVIDGYIADPLARMVGAHFTGFAVDNAKELNTIATAYDFLEAQLDGRAWLADEFGLADCTAGPALFYANLKQSIGDRPRLAGYFERLRARPSFARVIDEARPYRKHTPFDWPADY
ncbi:glutathione S-transferase family protein [Sphingomonas turrisvirgatae]|nr:glutathione S-transferase family protein [Sphingomonas turrisvirgatae]